MCLIVMKNGEMGVNLTVVCVCVCVCVWNCCGCRVCTLQSVSRETHVNDHFEEKGNGALI